MRRMLLALAAALLLTFVGAPAHAHDDLGDWEVLTTETGPAVGGEGIEVRVEARLTYAGDGHPATGTPSASITAEGPAGLAVGPALATETTVPGVFTATLVLPERGAWTLRLNALEPLAVLDVPIEVSALVEPPADETTEPGGTDPRETDPEEGDAAVAPPAAASDPPDATPAASAPDTASSSVLIGVGAGFVVLALVVWAVVRRRQQAGGVSRR